MIEHQHLYQLVMMIQMLNVGIIVRLYHVAKIK